MFYRIRKVIGIIGLYKNWGARIANHRIAKSGTLMLYLRNGLKFKIQRNTDDDAIVDELFIEEPYTKKAGFVIKTGYTVFDIGGQKGIFTNYAFSKGASVYTYEPFPVNYSFLKDNLRMNGFSDKNAYKKAVSNKSGQAILHLSEGSGSHSLFSKTGKLVKVETTSLDREIKSNKIKVIDLLKLDCEGAEYPIIYGSKLLPKVVKRISMEWHPIEGYKIEDLKKHLERNGFRVILNKNYLYAKSLILR